MDTYLHDKTGDWFHQSLGQACTDMIKLEARAESYFAEYPTCEFVRFALRPEVTQSRRIVIAIFRK